MEAGEAGVCPDGALRLALTSSHPLLPLPLPATAMVPELDKFANVDLQVCVVFARVTRVLKYRTQPGQGEWAVTCVLMRMCVCMYV